MEGRGKIGRGVSLGVVGVVVWWLEEWAGFCSVGCC